MSASAQTSSNALPPLAPPYGEIPPGFWDQSGPIRQHETAIIIGGILFLAVLFLIVRLLRRGQAPVIPPPEVVAREALAKRLNQPEDGRLLSAVSQILRQYLVPAFQLPATELTTAEFSAALAANEKIGPELATAIAGFLQECDRRKFAPTSPQAPLKAVGRALELVDAAEIQRARLSLRPEAAATAQSPIPPTT